MLRIAVYDDTREHCDEISALLERELKGRSAEIERFPSSGELQRYITSGGYRPDVAFLGVELWDGDGIEQAVRLNALVPSCRIVFVANSLHFATEVYRADHVWFILREELERRIGPALEKALAAPETVRGRSVLIRGKGRASLIPLERILYLERDGRRTLIRTEDGEYISSERPCQLLAGELAACFIRSHMSYWVNREKITAMEGGEFVLCDGTRIPISRSWRRAAKAAFLESR
ncbi:MAG: response regulator transcription factor [Oscillospiraceae bacterium]|nr:response regulator transcription factor [Oscillospiraceae bacterium]MBR0208500.1 response regulator transcription factor [Oscillospiraceae bacterium]